MNWTRLALVAAMLYLSGQLWQQWIGLREQTSEVAACEARLRRESEPQAVGFPGGPVHLSFAPDCQVKGALLEGKPTVTHLARPGRLLVCLPSTALISTKMKLDLRLDSRTESYSIDVVDNENVLNRYLRCRQTRSEYQYQRGYLHELHSRWEFRAGLGSVLLTLLGLTLYISIKTGS